MRKPYEERTELEKIQSQWKKLSGLHTREEWSAAIIRAATAAELAANFAIRKEFESRSDFNTVFVDNLLRWANGLAGKINRLLLPLSVGNKEKKKIMMSVKTAAETINRKRNSIVHQGEFCSKEEAREVIQQAQNFIETLVKIYEPKFALRRK
jgi:hypothetical protein